MVRRLLPLLALGLSVALFAVAPADAQKRRAVRSGPVTAPPPQGQCHTFGLVQAGRKASYSTTNTNGGTATFTITWVSDTPTKTVTTQKVTTAQGTSDVTTVLDGEVFGQLRGLKHINLKTTTAVPVLGSITTEVDVDFVPSLTQGPAAGWCVGNTWSVPPVTETIVTKTPGVPNQTLIVTTVGSTGEVLAVGEPVAAAGRTFDTVKYRGALVSGSQVQTAITWVSMEHNVVVKQETMEGSTVTSTTLLTSLQ
jgi:hypothetical protein